MNDRLTIRYKEDLSGTVTAFYVEMPGLVVQANSTKEAFSKLEDLFSSYLNKLFNSQ